ncbi:cyclic nucleotide-binding-like protein [Dunaliella salina]|uniref:Cyclic nucleotide-binding-like protein n=1 Tax=Dunaliella salina TaxID=3046 RepID=A0ABQ7G1W5_DUNSA|nr:cyclic nucleotide-binding-like protein [Dunaliella salina]|eukprot:KAF5828598.1 cyclic nucleotide-binding-like protein [Dunaliella salina]
MALLMAIIDPLHLAFAAADGLYPYDDFWAVMEYITIIIFGIDMALKFFIAYDDPEQGMVYEPKLIALNYFRFLFWVDLVTTLPIESIAIAGVGGNKSYNDRLCLFLGLIRWINLVRLYRVVGAFEFLNRKMMLGQVGLTLLRTVTVLFYVAHWMACVFYFIARVEGFTSGSWAGAVETMNEAEDWGRYFLALYFSFVILTGFGDNTFYDRNPVESCFVIGYLLVGVIMNAYILGSITTVMVADDEISHVFRERVESLNAFAKQKELPESLSELMREYLELLHHTETTSDELILHRYPPTLRKKVLRHLYLDLFRNCPPFRGCKTRFLDEVISMARMEVFNPGVLNEGDVVQELFVIAEGVVLGAKSMSSAAHERKAAKLRSKSSKSAKFGSMYGSGSMKPDQALGGKLEDSAQSFNGSVSMKRGPAMQGENKGSGSSHWEGASFFHDAERGSQSMNLGAQSMNPGTFSSSDGVLWADSKVNTYTAGQCFGHYSFFADGPSLQDYWTGSMARVLILNKPQLDELTERHPKQVKLMLSNLKQQVEEVRCRVW